MPGEKTSLHYQKQKKKFIWKEHGLRLPTAGPSCFTKIKRWLYYQLTAVFKSWLQLTHYSWTEHLRQHQRYTSNSSPYMGYTEATDCIPLVYCLLGDKKQETYHTVIDQLKRKMAEKELILDPTKLMCDFEAGLIPALRKHFPNSAVKGCYFHHTKALWAQVQDYGLVPDYNSDRHVKKVVRLLMALAFLPVLLVRPNFLVIEGSTTVQDSPKLQQLCDYYKSTWLNGSFPVALWNVNNQILRTNNLVEGWHNKLNRGIGKIHPNLFEVLTYLQKEQRETELTVSRARLGAAPPTRRPKYKKLEERITNLTQQHTDGTINSKEFLRQIRHVVHQF